MMTTHQFGDEIDAPPGRGVVVEAETIDGMFKMGIAAPHAIVSDEAPDLGGRSLAPRPLEYFSLGLGL